MRLSLPKNDVDSHLENDVRTESTNPPEELLMDKIIVYVDDAEYARQQLEPMMGSRDPAVTTHWLVVACAPRMTQRISKWVSHSSREKWRDKWVEKMFSQVTPWMQSTNSTVTQVTAKGPLIALTEQLKREHGAARVMDARRPKFGHDLAPITPEQIQAQDSKWAVPGTVAGLGAMLILAAE